MRRSLKRLPAHEQPPREVAVKSAVEKGPTAIPLTTEIRIILHMVLFLRAYNMQWSYEVLELCPKFSEATKAWQFVAGLHSLKGSPERQLHRAMKRKPKQY